MSESIDINFLPDDELKSLVQYLRGFTTEKRWERINRVLDMRTRHINVVLEDLYQPHNASAVMRSCDAFGIQDLFVVENQHRFQPSPGVSKGAEKWLSIQKFGGEEALERCLGKLKKEGFLIVATSPCEDGMDIGGLDVGRKTSLIFGAELTGLSEKTMELSDIRCRIPMAGFTESFNISVSAAICMYELTRKLRRSTISWGLGSMEKERLCYQWLMKSVSAGDEIVRQYFDNRNKNT